MFTFFRRGRWKILAVATDGFRSNFNSDQDLDIGNIDVIDAKKYNMVSSEYFREKIFKFGHVLKLHQNAIIGGKHKDTTPEHGKISFLTSKIIGLLALTDHKKFIKESDKRSNMNSRNIGSTISLHLPAINDSCSKRFTDNCDSGFEIPRQQKDEASTPEIMQFKASQKVLDPNKKTDDKEERQIVNDDIARALANLTKNITSPPNAKSKIKFSKQTPTQSDAPVEKKSRLEYDFTAIPYRSIASNILSHTPAMNPQQLEIVNLNAINRAQKDEIIQKDLEIAQLKQEINLLKIQSKKYSKASTSNYHTVGERRRQQLIKEEFEYLQGKYRESADEVISKLYNNLNIDDRHCFSPALTSHIFQTCGISLNKARKLRHELLIHDAPKFLASERKVKLEKKRIREGIEFEEIYVKLKVGTNMEKKLVTFMKDPGLYIQRRLQQIVDNKLYRKIEFNGVEELWYALTIDKAKTRTILGLLPGNTLKAINSRYNFSLLGIFEADDSLININAAFDIIFRILGKIQSLTFTTCDGEVVTLPVRWFYIADYKSEKAVAGIQSGNPKYPSVTCLSTMTETYAELDFDKKCVPRPDGFHAEYSQKFPSIAPFIPSSQFIPPPLHMTLGPGSQLFEYLFETVAKIDVQKNNMEDVYHLLKENSSWKKELKTAHKEIKTLESELRDIQENAELYETLLSSTKNQRKLKPCSLNNDCVVKLLKKNIPSHFVSCCDICSNLVHRCCKNDNETCPHCSPFKPTIETGRKRLTEEQDLINQRIAEIIITISEKQLILRQEAQKLSPGILTKTLEKVLEHHGGSRKAFFQAYSGAHLIKMGNNISKIKDDLPLEITSDPTVTVILEAIQLFFEAKKSMKKDFMSDEEITSMKEKIREFGMYMKTNLGTLKTKQKGHLFMFDAPEFVTKFKTASLFSDEAVESYHPLNNEQDQRIKCKECPKRYALQLKWAIDHNYYFDNVDCKSYED